jgi:hypothetical protein
MVSNQDLEGDNLEVDEIQKLKRQWKPIDLLVPTRPIIDINSSRLVKPNIVDTILIPKVDSADADRVRNINEILDQVQDEMDK